jgi:hypothetical protein
MLLPTTSIWDWEVARPERPVTREEVMPMEEVSVYVKRFREARGI